MCGPTEKDPEVKNVSNRLGFIEMMERDEETEDEETNDENSEDDSVTSNDPIAFRNRSSQGAFHEALWIQVLESLFGMTNTTILAIETPDNEANFYASLREHQSDDTNYYAMLQQTLNEQRQSQSN